MSKAIPIKYEYRGQMYTIAELAKFARVDAQRLRNRLRPAEVARRASRGDRAPEPNRIRAHRGATRGVPHVCQWQLPATSADRESGVGADVPELRGRERGVTFHAHIR